MPSLFETQKQYIQETIKNWEKQLLYFESIEAGLEPLYAEVFEAIQRTAVTPATKILLARNVYLWLKDNLAATFERHNVHGDMEMWGLPVGIYGDLESRNCFAIQSEESITAIRGFMIPEVP